MYDEPENVFLGNVGEFKEVDYRSNVGDLKGSQTYSTDACVKEILLSDSNSGEFFKLNTKRLIRKTGAESPIWESYREYKIGLSAPVFLINLQY